MSEIIEGRDLTFFVEGKPIARAENVNIEVIEVSKDDITDEFAYLSVFSDNLFELEGGAFDTLWDLMGTRSKVHIKFDICKDFTTSNGWTVNKGIHEGECYIKELGCQSRLVLTNVHAKYYVSFWCSNTLTKNQGDK